MLYWDNENDRVWRAEVGAGLHVRVDKVGQGIYTAEVLDAAGQSLGSQSGINFGRIAQDIAAVMAHRILRDAMLSLEGDEK